MAPQTYDQAGLVSTQRSLPIALLRAREVVMGPIREMLAGSPVTEQKWRVLRVLDESGPMEQTAIASATCLMLPSLTRILKGMDAGGFVDRKPDPADRRRTIVSLTADGRRVLNRHAAQSRQLAARIEDRLGREKLDDLLDLLEELRNLDLPPPHGDRYPEP